MTTGHDAGAPAGARLSRAERSRQALETGHLMADLGRRTVKGGAIAMGAQGIRMTLQLASAAIMARLLAPEDFGLIAMALVVTGFVGIFTDLGLSAATIQRDEIDQDTVSALFFINLGMGLLVMLAAIAVAPTAAWFFDDERVLWVVIAMSATIPLGAAAAQHGALLTRGMRWGAIQWTGIAAQLFGITVGVLIAWRTDLGYWALVAQGWASGVLGLALVWIVCPWRPSRVRNWTGVRSALTFGLNLTGFNVVNYFHRQLDNILIGWRWGPTELGFYNRAYTLLLMPIGLISGPIGSAVVPALSRLQNDPERWRRSFLDALTIVTFAGSGLAAVLIVTAEPLVLFVLGPAWENTATIFQLLAISMFAATPMNAMGWIYVSLGHTNRMLKWSLLFTPFVALTFILSVQKGVEVLALSYSLIMIAGAVPCFAFACRGTPVTKWQILRQISPFVFCGIVVTVAGLIAERYLMGGVGGALFLLLFIVITYMFISASILLLDPRQSFLLHRVISAGRALQVKLRTR